jgi:CII-binding regulator of phage lambda lysogenization HflD
MNTPENPSDTFRALMMQLESQRAEIGAKLDRLMVMAVGVEGKVERLADVVATIAEQIGALSTVVRRG